MTSGDIRARIDSFWLNSLEAELLGCVVYALADVVECLEDIRRCLQPAPSHLLDLRDTGDTEATRKLQPAS